MKAESQMKAAKTQKNLKEIPYSPRKSILKRKENNILGKKINYFFTFSEIILGGAAKISTIFSK